MRKSAGRPGVEGPVPQPVSMSSRKLVRRVAPVKGARRGIKLLRLRFGPHAVESEMSERLVSLFRWLARALSDALGPNPLDTVFPRG